MLLQDFDFDLPEELVAQKPIEPRDHSRLMVINRATGSITHDQFFNLPQYLLSSDLLVFNQSKVFPARLYGQKESGGKVEILLLSITYPFRYISHPGLKTGQKIIFSSDLKAVVQDDCLEFNKDYAFVRAYIDKSGHTPLPPYIDPHLELKSPNEIRSRYQTIYAKDEGSIAAPTAGFHFTEELLNKIPHKEYVTLHVGLGTFKPVKTENIEDHHMHS